MRTAVLLCTRVGIQAITLILLSRLLAPSTYGSYAAAASLAVVLGTLPSLGSGYVLLAQASRKKALATDTWRYAWPLTLVIGAMLIVVYMYCGWYVTKSAPVSLLVLFWLGATELILNPLILLLSFVMQGCERIVTSQFLQWLPLFLRAIAALLCFTLATPDRLSSYTAMQLGASLIGIWVALAVTKSHVNLTGRPRLMTWKELRLGASYAAMHLVAYNPSELDKIVAVRSLGAYSAGIYTAASRMLGAFAMPMSALLLAAQPRLFRHSENTHKQNKRLISLIALIAVIWGLSGTVIFAFGHQVIPWLLGPAYTETGQLVPWLALTMPFLTLRLAAGGILVALGRPLERMLFELSGVLILTTGIVFFTPKLQTLGLIIAVIGSELSMAIIGWWRIWKNLQAFDIAYAH
jgi:O-antigen/teichoic acid export membrane protein